MALKRVIPCLDVDAGRVVKGTNFVDIRDAGDPVELAERYDAEGADELVFLDITASHEARDTIVELARRTADNVFIPFTIGGGIRSVADAQAVLDGSYSAADRERDEDVVGGPPGELDDRVAALVRGGDVEEDELVGALGVVALGELDRVAGVAQSDEVGSLDDPPGLDVEAGDQA